jgi:hypothetical protein
LRTDLRIPELAVVEITRQLPSDPPVAYGVVVSADKEQGSYLVEVVDPRDASRELVHALPERVRVKRVI